MLRTWTATLIIALAAITPGAAQATLFEFDFESSFGDLLDGQDSLTFNGTDGVDQYQLVIAATGGNFNKTSSGFGINAPGSGDDTDALDNGLASEAIGFSFASTADVGIKVVSIEFDRLTGSGGVGEDQALLAFYDESGSLDNSVVVTNANTAGDDTANFNGVAFPEQIFNPGSFFDMSVQDGNGFGIEKLVIEVSASLYTGDSGGGGGAVPEPAAACMLFIGLISVVGLWRRRR